MNLNVLYFARLRENLGIAQENIALPDDAASVAKLLEHLRARGGDWQTVLAPTQTYRVAVNQALAEMTTSLHDGDEIALFPPVTGG